MLSFVLFLIIYARVDGFQVGHAENLTKTLLHNYDKKIRPTGMIKIEFELLLNQIVNVIASEQTILVNVWVNHLWVDSRLTWLPSEYNGVNMTRMCADMLWKPDTFVYDRVDQYGLMTPQQGEYFIVKHDGTVFWENSITGMKILCHLEVFWFPFDYQICQVKFGSWSHTIDHLNYTLKNPSRLLSYYSENSEWHLRGYKVNRVETIYETWIEQKPFTELVLKVLLKRKSQFVINDCVLPAVLLSFLTLLSFFIPFSQQIVLDISIILSYSVLALRISEEVPIQSERIPLLSLYFTACMIFSLFIIVWFTTLNKLRKRQTFPKLMIFLITFYIVKLLENREKYDRLRAEYKKQFESKVTPKSNAMHQSIDNKNPYIIEIQSNSTVKSQSSESSSQTKKLVKQMSTQNQLNKKTILTTKKNFKMEIISVLNKCVFLLFFVIFIVLHFVVIIILPSFINVPTLDIEHK